MTSNLKLKRLSIDDGDGLLHFQISLSNGDAAATLDFYGYDDEFIEFGEQLRNFPQLIDSTVTYQMGEDTEQWAYYLLLEAFCYEANGSSALRVRVKNHLKEPYNCDSSFCILMMPAELNRLGGGLSNWNSREDIEFVWPPLN
jgi:hypothetical protein